MKKLLVWAIVLMICFGFTASAAAIEETVFGPMFIKKEKGKAKKDVGDNLYNIFYRHHLSRAFASNPPFRSIREEAA